MSEDVFNFEKAKDSNSCALTLKDHPQIPVIIDTLSRKENYHVSLIGTSSQRIQNALLKSIALHLSEGFSPRSLKQADFVYFDERHLENPAEFFKTLSESSITIIALEKYHPSLKTFMHNPAWRFILLNANDKIANFTSIQLIELTDIQILNLLKTYKSELENYHHVLIPDETFSSALSLATLYLGSQARFDKTLDLLDSAASRASSIEHLGSSGQFKPIVTSNTLSAVISSWTQIPSTNLQNNSFQITKLKSSLQTRVFGQDPAISMIGGALQHAYLKLQEKTGPLCNFLFVGPSEVGKKTTAQVLAEHLFGHKRALLRIDHNEVYHSVSQIKIITEENHTTSLLSAISDSPYAVILIENIHQLPAANFALFKNIIAHAVAFDEQGKKYDFRHAIVIMTTTLGADRITSLIQPPSLQETNKTLDLMQLVLNEHPGNLEQQINHHLSPEELCEELIPTLENYFSATYLQYLNIIPFVPLDYAAFEKIVRLKLKICAKRLETQFGIELNYAPEVIKFLAHEALWRKPETKPIEKLLEQHLYSAIANEILANAENKHSSKRLMLQLNDSGQLLRCEFLTHGVVDFAL